jgi:N-acetyl-gamma-glutamyl-phosphate reductase
MRSIVVAILGDGDAGKALNDIMERHPNVDTPHMLSSSEFRDFEGSDVVFSALPAGVSAGEVARFRDRGCTVIDMSGDLRFPTLEQYERWYGTDKKHPAPRLISDRVPYGLSEINRQQLEPGLKLVSGPGCYATAVILAMAPLHERDMIESGSVTTIAAGSGYSGRGKNADNSDILRPDGSGYNTKQYKPGRTHQHVGEIEHVLNGQNILFNPSVLPIRQGILATLSIRLARGVTPEAAAEALHEAYDHEPFVKVLQEGEPLETAAVAGSHECHIGFTALKDTIFMSSGLDNLFKGASSTATQVFNLIQGLPETAGLTPKQGWQPA